jgi:hypothetical protein
MEYKKIQPLLTLSVIFLAGAVLIGYYLDMPIYRKTQEQRQDIVRLEKSNELKTNYENKIKEITAKLQEAKWEEKKNKIEVIFESSPFFLSKSEIFFRDIVIKNGMTFSSVTFTPAAPIKTASQQTTQTTGEDKSTKKDFKPQENQTVEATSQSTGGLSSIKGPVNKTGFILNASGSYLALKSLLQGMEKQSFLISIKAIAFSAIDSSGKASFTLTGDIYSY